MSANPHGDTEPGLAPGQHRRETDTPMYDALNRRLADVERLTQQLLQELYGMHGQDGMRTEIKMLRIDQEERRKEAVLQHEHLMHMVERVQRTVVALSEARTPRWLTISFLALLAGCAVVIAIASWGAGR